MNKEFVSKMLQAKRLEYQALKEVLPECMIKRLTKLENEWMDFGKELIMTVFDSDEKTGNTSASDGKSELHKVTIE